MPQEVKMWMIFMLHLYVLMDIIASEASQKKRIKIHEQAARGAP